MQTREDWPRWVALLQRYHLNHFAAWMLEAAGPLALLGAQALYFVRSFIGAGRADSLARILENESETRAFIALLDEEAG